MFQWDMSCLIALIIGILCLGAQIGLSVYFAKRLPARIVTRPAWFPGKSANTVLPKRAVLIVTPAVSALIGVGGVLLAGFHTDVILQVIVADALQALWLLSVGWVYTNNRSDWH